MCIWVSCTVGLQTELHSSPISERKPSAGFLPHAAELLLHPITNQHDFFFFKHDLLYASWTENSTGFSSCSFSMKKKEQLVCSRAFGVIKVNIILATVIELHSCYHSSTWAPPTKEKTSDGEGRGHGESRERASELRPRNAKGKIKLRRRKTKSRAGERQRERENQYLALKRGLHQRCNYAKCVLFTRQQATEISQPGGLEPN